MKRSHILLLIATVCGVAIIVTASIACTTFTPVAIVAGLVITIFIILTCLACIPQNSPEKHAQNKDNTTCQTKLIETSQQLHDIQEQLLAQEKMASIGMLTAGIAHEIKNPLNFINNFSDMTVEMLEELKAELAKLPDNTPKKFVETTSGIIDDIATNCQKINEHGKRAESIIKNMLIQSRSVEGEKNDCNINALLDEYLSLAYHGMRAQNNKFNVKIEKQFDPNLPTIIASPQSMGRVFLNIINNGLYAANEKGEAQTKSHAAFMPTMTVSTTQDSDNIIIKIRDNGNGIPDSIRKKIFEPFFTTKPPGKGTGLGLPICYDIVVKEHAGKLDIVSVPNEFTEFVLILPKDKTKMA